MTLRNTHRDENAAANPQPKHGKRYATRASATAAAAVAGVTTAAAANLANSRRALADLSNKAVLQPLGNAKISHKPHGAKKRAAGDDPIARRTRASRRRAEMDQVEPNVTEPSAQIEDPDVLTFRLHASSVVQGENSAISYAASLTVPDGVVDIDSSDAHLDEPSLAVSILRSHQSRESSSMASPTYMIDVQHDLTPRMRLILIDWLVDVHRNFRMESPSLYLAVNIVDRFLTTSYIVRSKLQLVGIAALWMASKYEEIYPPVLDDFVGITDWTYTREAVIGMEALICNRLGFRLTVVTPLPFLTRNLKALSRGHPADDYIEQFAHYAAELALCEYGMVRHPPSLLAASSVALAMQATPYCQIPWDSTMQFHSGGYTIAQLFDCAAELWELVQKSSRPGSKHTAVRRKYSDQKYGAISQAADEFYFSFAEYCDN